MFSLSYRSGNGEYWWNLCGSYLRLNRGHFYGYVGVFMDSPTLGNYGGKSSNGYDLQCWQTGSRTCKSHFRQNLGDPIRGWSADGTVWRRQSPSHRQEVWVDASSRTSYARKVYLTPELQNLFQNSPADKYMMSVVHTAKSYTPVI